MGRDLNGSLEGFVVARATEHASSDPIWWSFATANASRTSKTLIYMPGKAYDIIYGSLQGFDKVISEKKKRRAGHHLKT